MEDYRLEQSGQEVQDILNGAAMQSDLTAETERATEAEQTLQGNIDAEATRAQDAEGTLQDNIDAEEARAKAAEKQNADDIDAIEEKIPSGASSSNKLATEEYVADAVATATATFRGTYNLVSDLHLNVTATEQQIAAALAGAISTADNNDYCFILVPTSSETPTEIKEIDRYKFNGTAWAFEYKLNNSGFTAAQWAAINSGITSGDVAKLAALPTNAQLTTLLAGLQSDIDGEETRAKAAELALQGNIDAEEARAKAAEKQNADDIDAIEAVIPESASSENKVATKSEIDSLSAAIEAILLLIPSAATSLNKLADKAYVNSSIATATATFRGTYNLVNDLGLTTSATHAQIATALAGSILTADNNDYAFVQIPTSDAMPTEIAKTERYKFNGTAWEYEYDLNNSGFTADQWAAINSGITQALVTKLRALPTNAELTTELGTLTSSITAINQKIPNAASQANKLVDTAAMESYIVQVLDVLTISYNVTSTDGHVTLSIEQVDGKITSVTLTTSDIASATALNLKASQADLTALASRVTTAEGNITSLGGRMTTAEGNITSLGGRMTTAEGNITSLGGRVSTNETDIANLQQLYNDLQQSKPVPVTALPSTGQQQGVIYRLAGTTSYSDYMWNGTTWVLMATYNNAIDPRPKKASQNLVTSGGVFDNMGALDVSELNATENPHTLAQYVDLSAALAAIPTDYQKGGMSIKFVQSSDNKYVQYRLMADEWSINTEDWAIADEGIYVENPEFIEVKTDAEDKILEATEKDGTKVFGGDVNLLGNMEVSGVSYKVVENPEFINIETDSEGKMLSSRNNKGVKKEYVAFETPHITTDLIDSKESSSEVCNISGKINLSNNAKEKLKEDLNLNEATEYSFDVANGNLQAFGTYKSELEASPIINDDSKHYVGYSSSKTKIRKKNTSKVIVGINHDDLYPSDYIGNRKIYNKYGFNANFNYIVRPFWNKQEQEQKVKEVKKMVEDGNTIGLHAMWGTYWMMNRLFDVTPNGNSWFAPALSDLRGNNPDGTGINAYGVNITSDTTVIGCGYTSSPKYGNTKVVELTEAQVNEINREYTIYGNTCSDGGLDLTGAQAGNKKYLWWLEYWYNNLIDDTLGYSSDSEVIAERFAEDYDVPSDSSASDYYPDKEHLISGKIVFFDDTSNPHYNDAEYQKVGRFKKGLFKGCASCCNYEVMDRYFKIANAFLKYYFGIDSVKHYSPHGQFYFSKFTEQSGIKYFDVDHNFALSYRTKMYMSRLSSFISAADIMLSMGIRSSYLLDYSNIIIDKLLYSDCYGKLPDCFNGWIHGDYLNSIGTNEWLGISYSDFSTFMDGIDNWTEFLFENAGKTVTRNGVTLKVFTILRDYITIINSAIDTGIIPAFGIDTIISCPNMSIATELLLRYCYKEGIDVVPFSMLSSIAQSSSSKGEIIKDNYFPNPTFNQSILRSVGNVSMAVPDGWAVESTVGSPIVSVENTENSMTVSANTGSKAVIYSKICNIPSGTYTLKFKISGTDDPSGTINVHKVINGDTGINEDNKILSVSTTSSYSEETVDFQVPVYHRNPDNRSSVINQICDGYEDNFAFLYIEIICQNGASLTIKECSIKKV